MLKKTQLIFQSEAMDGWLREHRSASSGAEVVFSGIVRTDEHKRAVEYLEFEAYESMVHAEADRIFEEVEQQWKVNAVVLTHRLGRVFPGEAAVVLAVYARHRYEAFAACQYIMDELKKRLPIWKKEVFADGEAWVHPHP